MITITIHTPTKDILISSEDFVNRFERYCWKNREEIGTTLLRSDVINFINSLITDTSV